MLWVGESKELSEMMDAYMKAFSANTREIGRIDGFNEEKVMPKKILGRA